MNLTKKMSEYFLWVSCESFLALDSEQNRFRKTIYFRSWPESKWEQKLVLLIVCHNNLTLFIFTLFAHQIFQTFDDLMWASTAWKSIFTIFVAYKHAIIWQWNNGPYRSA